MKKQSIRLLSLIFAVIFTILSLSFSVSAKTMFLGDSDGNMIISANDARFALRCSVGLEKISALQAITLDTDNNGSITAADARIILRTSVGLEAKKTIEIPENEPEQSSIEIHFIDVGQADCSLVLCDGDTLLIDGGNTEDSDDIIEYLDTVGVDTLDYVICTHAHEDHVGGLADVLESFTVTENIFAPQTGADTKCYNNFLDEAAKQNKEIITPTPGYTFSLGNSTVEILGPVTEEYNDINDTSIVTKISLGNKSFLFTGDMEREAEQDLLDAGASLKANVLKVGHHGSENSTTYPFLREVMPEIAVISVGEDNKYGHPTEEALSRLRDADVKVYRTDMQGHIIIKSDGKSINVTTQKNPNASTNPTTPSVPDEPNTPTTPTPDITDTPDKYIGNVNSKKLHLPTCSSLPKEENRIYFATIKAAKNAGYDACSRCKPF